MKDESNHNRLINETSPYLLQHAHNPVDWFPWGEEAFRKAGEEDKPVFLSIGYSTCHWCHVMAHESFENETVADVLNRLFVPVKVDKEERPDIDGVYMRACQAMTGSGGWPTSLFLTPEGKPFYAGTYFPKAAFVRLLESIDRAWRQNREGLLQSSEQVVNAIEKTKNAGESTEEAPVRQAVDMFRVMFDKEYGGFGSAPKFPSPHNLLFLLRTAPDMAEKTLRQMALGGIFDHVGGGFSRYSTDRQWLAPHFEKMLYDNALLAMAYSMAYETTGEEFYKNVAVRVFEYLEREMAAPEGGFYSAQDADSDGVEGKYYLFTPDEVERLLGTEDGRAFCRRYSITEEGNFEGMNIPNLLKSGAPDEYTEKLLPRVYSYRRGRMKLHTDTKILTSWNALAAAVYAIAARVLKSGKYARIARDTVRFLSGELTEGDTVFAGLSGGKHSGPGFLDDYAFFIFALLQMHQATLEDTYLRRAAELARKVISSFRDAERGGYFFSGAENEKLITRLKETWDGAIPSGNSVMAYNLTRLALLTGDEVFQRESESLNAFMNDEAGDYPSGYGFYLYASLPIRSVVCVPAEGDDLSDIQVKSDWAFRITDSPEYPRKDGRTTYYVCENGTCLPPTNEIS